MRSDDYDGYFDDLSSTFEVGVNAEATPSEASFTVTTYATTEFERIFAAATLNQIASSQYSPTVKYGYTTTLTVNSGQFITYAPSTNFDQLVFMSYIILRTQRWHIDTANTDDVTGHFQVEIDGYSAGFDWSISDFAFVSQNPNNWWFYGSGDATGDMWSNNGTGPGHYRYEDGIFTHLAGITATFVPLAGTNLSIRAFSQYTTTLTRQSATYSQYAVSIIQHFNANVTRQTAVLSQYVPTFILDYSVVLARQSKHVTQYAVSTFQTLFVPVTANTWTVVQYSLTVVGRAKIVLVTFSRPIVQRALIAKASWKVILLRQTLVKTLYAAIAGGINKFTVTRVSAVFSQDDVDTTGSATGTPARQTITAVLRTVSARGKALITLTRQTIASSVPTIVVNFGRRVVLLRQSVTKQIYSLTVKFGVRTILSRLSLTGSTIDLAVIARYRSRLRTLRSAAMHGVSRFFRY